ncbi:MAG TPA: dihydrodipicolinate synthase family protein [Edaphobacter sp.]|jgi:dihydrodipicolinate synthase/N-acetylneuraminate lyase
MLLEGLQLPLTTPFYPDGRLNLLKLEYNVARYSKTPVAGLVALSEFGEPTMLSEDETRQTLRSVAGAAGAEKVLMAGVSRDSVAGTLDFAETAAELEYDAVLVKPPSFLRAGVANEHARSLLTYFRVVADRSPLPVVLYSSASVQGGLLPIEMVIELAGHPQIIGLVNCGGGRERIGALREERARVKREVFVTAVFAAVTGRMKVRDDGAAGGVIGADTLTGGGAALAVAPAKMAAKTRTKVVGFQVLGGNTAGMLEDLRAGAVGAMPAFAASAPQACYEVLAAWKDGDEGLAREKQVRLQSVAEKMEEELGVAGIKFGCDLNGYFGGRPRLPLLPLTGEERAKIEMLMQGMRH